MRQCMLFGLGAVVGSEQAHVKAAPRSSSRRRMSHRRYAGRQRYGLILALWTVDRHSQWRGLFELRLPTGTPR